MAAPRIAAGAMPGTALNSEAVGWFRVVGEFDSIEFSVDDGATWASTASLAGGTLTEVEGVGGQAGVQVVPTTVGEFGFLLRPVSAANGVGDAFSAVLNVLDTAADGWFRRYDTRLTFRNTAAAGTGVAWTGEYTDSTLADPVEIDGVELPSAGTTSATGARGAFVALWGQDGNVAWVATYRRDGDVTVLAGDVVGVDGIVYAQFRVQRTSGSPSANLYDGTGTLVHSTGLVGSGEEDIVVAFDEATGEALWELPVVYKLSDNSTPTTQSTFWSTDGAHLTISPDGDLYAVARLVLQTGEQLDVYAGLLYNATGNITGSGGQAHVSVVKIDASTGEPEWVRILSSRESSGGLNSIPIFEVFDAAASSIELAMPYRFFSARPLYLWTEPAVGETYYPSVNSIRNGTLTINGDGSIGTTTEVLTGGAATGRLFARAGGGYIFIVTSTGTPDFGDGAETNTERAWWVVTYSAGLTALNVVKAAEYDDNNTLTAASLAFSLDKDGGALLGINFDGDLLLPAETLVSEGGIDAALIRVNPNDDSVTFAQVFRREDAVLNDVIRVVGPAPSGGGVGYMTATSGAVDTTLAGALGDAALTIPGSDPAVTHPVLFTFDEDGLPGDLPDFSYTPPPGIYGPASPFVQVSWPATGTEDTPLSSTASVSNPDIPEPDPIGGGVTFDPNAGSTVPGSVTGLTAVAGNTQAFLEWAPVAGATSYRVYKADLIGDIPVAEVSGAEATITGLANGTGYTFRVEAANALGVGPKSSVSVTPTASGPFNTVGLQWSALRWELWDAAAGQWFTGSRAIASDQFGRGTFTITPYDPAVHTDPEDIDYIAPYTADIQFVPEPNWNGTVRSLLRVVATRSDGAILTSPAVALVTDVAAVYDGVTTPEGSMPGILENQVSVGAFTTEAPDGGYLTWELSPQTDEPYDTTSTTAITVLRDGNPVGTAAITGGQGTPQAQVSFTPIANVNGLFSFSLRVGDGGDGDGDDGWSSWVFLTVDVGSVATPPSIPSPATMPTIDEDDGPALRTFTVTDADVDPGGDEPEANWELATSPYDNMARDDFVTLAAGLVEIIDEDEPADADDLSVNVRYTPALNFHGTYAFYLRAWKNGPDGRLTGPWRRVTGTVNPVADRPTAPLPRRMPTVEAGQVAVGTFTTFDPDGAPWTWEVAPASGGTWGSTATLTDVGTLAVSGTTTTGTVRFTPDTDFAGGRYQFWLRVTDNSSLTSDPVLVRGFVAVQEPTAFLTLLEREEDDASLRRLGALPIVELSITDSVTGPGGAAVTVPTERLRAIAAAESWSVDELLYPGGVELHVAVGGQLVFAGPVTGHSVEADLVTTRLDAEGLAAYLNSRAIEGATAASFVAERPDEIMVSLLGTAQGLDYGELLITDETTPVGDPFSTSFDAGTNLSDAFDEVGTRLGGPEWWVTPDRELRTAAIRGADKRDSVLLTDGCAELEREADDSKLATVAEVDGDEVLGAALADPAVLARFGRRYVRLSAERLDTEVAADALAAQHVADFGTPVPVRRLTHYVQRGSVVQAFDYEAGDAIRVESTGPDGLERVGVRVINRTAKLVGPGAWVVDSDVEVVADGALRPARSRHLPSLYDSLYDAVFGR